MPETITRSGELLPVEPAANSTALTLVILRDTAAPYAMETPYGQTQGYDSLKRLRAAMTFVFGVVDARVRPSERKPKWHIAGRRLA